MNDLRQIGVEKVFNAIIIEGSWLVKAIKNGLNFSYDKELRDFETCPDFDEEIPVDFKVFFSGYWSDQDRPINRFKS